ncbi:hypothetical protein YC2023_083163 [Brassica napus]
MVVRLVSSIICFPTLIHVKDSFSLTLHPTNKDALKTPVLAATCRITTGERNSVDSTVNSFFIFFLSLLRKAIQCLLHRLLHYHLLSVSSFSLVKQQVSSYLFSRSIVIRCANQRFDVPVAKFSIQN